MGGVLYNGESAMLCRLVFSTVALKGQTKQLFWRGLFRVFMSSAATVREEGEKRCVQLFAS